MSVGSPPPTPLLILSGWTLSHAVTTTYLCFPTWLLPLEMEPGTDPSLYWLEVKGKEREIAGNKERCLPACLMCVCILTFEVSPLALSCEDC